MSFWLRMGVKIEDLECFKRSCEQNGITYEVNEDQHFMYQGSPVVATIRDTRGSGFGYLVRKGGAIQMEMDTDPNYNTIVQRLGSNGGRLGRDYTEMVIRKETRKSGGMVTQAQEQPDGSLIVRVAVA